MCRYLIILAAIGLSTLPNAQAREGSKLPNILFFIVDDLRPELGCYGNQRAISPHIDRLADAGTLFERAFCQVPVCGASRASMMTGLYPTGKRFVNYFSRAETDAPEVPDIPAWLKSKGYTTISNGKVYHESDDNQASWDEIYRPADFRVYLLPENQGKKHKQEQVAYEAADVDDDAYPSGRLANKVMSDLKKAKAVDKPYFITAGFTKPHLPFNAPKKYWDMFSPADIRLAANPFKPRDVPEKAMHEWNELRRGYAGIPQQGPLSDDMARKMIHGYLACTTYTDAMIGRVLDTLHELEMERNTIIILAGDHGWQLGEHSLWCKHALFSTSLRTPLIIAAPGYQSKARVKGLVEFVDIYPTLCELAGIAPPGHLQGSSLRPMLMDSNTPGKKAVFSRLYGGESVVTEDYLYAEWADGSNMLFSHSQDPDENVNISGIAKNNSMIQSMRTLLNTHKQTVTP